MGSISASILNYGSASLVNVLSCVLMPMKVNAMAAAMTASTATMDPNPSASWLDIVSFFMSESSDENSCRRVVVVPAQGLQGWSCRRMHYRLEPPTQSIQSRAIVP